MREPTTQEQQFLEATQAQMDEEYEKEYQPLNRAKRFFSIWMTLFFIQFMLLYVITPLILGLFDTQKAEGMKAFVTQPYVLILISIYITYRAFSLCTKKPKPAIAIAYMAEEGQTTITKK